MLVVLVTLVLGSHLAGVGCHVWARLTAVWRGSSVVVAEGISSSLRLWTSHAV
jgi:hypothetical protein